MNMNKTVILTCTSLKDYVELTQKKLNTDFPVIYLSRLYHRDPAEMREHVISALEGLDRSEGRKLLAEQFHLRVPRILIISNISL